MKERMSRGFLVLVLVLAAGCTSQAGPFVTNIRYAGPGLLSVEKCMVEFTNYGTNVGSHVSTEDCTNEVIALRPPMPPEPPPRQSAPPAPPPPEM